MVSPLQFNVMKNKKMLERCTRNVDQDTGNGKAFLPDHVQPKHLDILKKLKGGKNPRLWGIKVPRRRRSWVPYKKISPMKKFRKQLVDLWNKHGNLDESSPEEVFLFNNVNNFIPSNEIGLGGVILKPDDTSA